MINMLLSVQVDATRPLFDGHDGEANIDAAMKFSPLNLWTFGKNIQTSP